MSLRATQAGGSGRRKTITEVPVVAGDSLTLTGLAAASRVRIVKGSPLSAMPHQCEWTLRHCIRVAGVPCRLDRFAPLARGEGEGLVQPSECLQAVKVVSRLQHRLC